MFRAMIDYEKMNINDLKDNLKMVIRAINDFNQRIEYIEQWCRDLSSHLDLSSSSSLEFNND